MDTIWRGLTGAELDRGYNARASVPDFAAEMAEYAGASEAARAMLPVQADLVFDAESGNALDWFPGAPGGPVLLWVHGGYWRALSKADQSCVAPGLTAGGVHVAVMDYSLAPAAPLDRIVHQVRTALAWVVRHASGQGADPARIFAGGSSAGGHLTGMLMSGGWHQEYGVRPDILRGGIALSGLFDLEPIRLSHVNEWMRLDADAARRNSPLHQIPRGGPAPRLLAAYGGLETEAFKRQTEEYAAAWSNAGHDATVLRQLRCNHFNLVGALGRAADPLCQAAIRFMEG